MPKPYMTPIKFGKENQEDKDRKDKNLFQYDAFQRRVNMDPKTLTHPILATFLAPYIRNSSLYKDEFWDVRTYDVRDEIRIEEGLDCYQITRIRKDVNTAEILTVSEQIPLPKEAREKFEIVCKEIYTWAHARLSDSSDQDRQRPN